MVGKDCESGFRSPVGSPSLHAAVFPASVIVYIGGDLAGFLLPACPPPLTAAAAEIPSEVAVDFPSIPVPSPHCCWRFHLQKACDLFSDG